MFSILPKDRSQKFRRSSPTSRQCAARTFFSGCTKRAQLTTFSRSIHIPCNNAKASQETIKISAKNPYISNRSFCLQTMRKFDKPIHPLQLPSINTSFTVSILMSQAMYSTQSPWGQSFDQCPTYSFDPTWPESCQNGMNFGGVYPESSGHDAPNFLFVPPDFDDP